MTRYTVRRTQTLDVHISGPYRKEFGDVALEFARRSDKWGSDTDTYEVASVAEYTPPPWEPTHYSVTDGSPARMVEPPKEAWIDTHVLGVPYRASRVLATYENEDGDRWMSEPQNWTPIRKRSCSHTRTSTEHGPDYCLECSEARNEWVRWPCGHSDDSEGTK